jgi:hypothetical protein
MAAGLVCRSTRRLAGGLATAYLVLASLFLAITLKVSPRPCGCLGGWLQVAPWINVLLTGATLVATIQIMSEPRQVATERT